MIGGRTALYAVVGWPVAHSLSPAMHNAAFAEAGLDAAYLALPVSPERLGAALEGAHALGVAGLNVTVPHKQGAARACHRLDPTAALCGAANTLRRLDDGWEGFNTDAPATLELLRGAGLRPGARALLLGAGGAALAGAWALLTAGAELEVAARRADAAEALAARLAPAFPQARLRAVPWGEAAARAEACDAVVNATSIGLGGKDDGLPPLRFRAGQVVADYVYGPTRFAAGAREAGARLVTGEAILVRQGALAFTLWTGVPAPEAVMAAALARAGEGRR
jgi:shikimate dehydrogenase